MICLWSSSSIRSQKGHSCSICGMTFLAMTKNSAMAWAGEANRKMVRPRPTICHGAKPALATWLARWRPSPAKTAAAGPWKNVTRRTEKTGRLRARTMAREASAEVGCSPRSSARSAVVIGRTWRAIM